MIEWNIPPIGFCSLCLARGGKKIEAVTIYTGKSVCQPHLMELYHHAE